MDPKQERGGFGRRAFFVPRCRTRAFLPTFRPYALENTNFIDLNSFDTMKAKLPAANNQARYLLKSWSLSR